jgi:outer membrane protein TolC
VQDKAEQQLAAGLATPLDVSRARLDVLAARQRLETLQAESAKTKIDLARIIGAPTDAGYEIATDVPYSPAPRLPLDEAVAQALTRPEIRAAAEQLAAAERSRDSTRNGRLPSAVVIADLGASQAMSDPVRATYMVAGVLRVPIWQGGRVEARLEQASATVLQRRAQLDDLKARAEAEVRRADLDVRIADGRVSVARESLSVMRDTLAFVQQQSDIGLGEPVGLARARESAAAAQVEYIASVTAHNAAKLALARAVGRAFADLPRFLLLP